MNRDPYIGMPITIGESAGACGGAGVGTGGSESADAGGSGGYVSVGRSSLGGPYGASCKSFDGMHLGKLPVAMSYVPVQQWKTVYPPEQALIRGTVFPELELPFIGGMKR